MNWFNVCMINIITFHSLVYMRKRKFLLAIMNNLYEDS
jgi:hypothetical protein